MSVRDLPPLRDVLAAHGLSANKALGQHFLLDLNVTDKIARLAGPFTDETVIEIGPGPGGLTRSLLMAGAPKVIAIEKDERFVPIIEDIGLVSEGRLSAHLADGLKVDPAALCTQRPMRIAANLPYNVGTKMLINWLTAEPIFWDRMVLMFQKEVAERVVAGPGDKAYGRLAILCQSVARAHMAFDVPARAFTPPPKVDSAVVVLELLPDDRRYSALKTLARVTEAAFGQRRKMLRRSLRTLAKQREVELETWLASCDIDPQARPETLPVTDFHKLADYLIKTAP